MYESSRCVEMTSILFHTLQSFFRAEIFDYAFK